MMRRLAERSGLVLALVFAWKLGLLMFAAQPVPANDAFFYDGPVVNYLLHGKFINPSLALVLPISGNEVFSAYPPLYHLVLLGWMSVFGTSALSAMWLHLLLFGVYAYILLGIFRELKVPAVGANLASLFLLSITFHDRPDSLAHVLGMAAVSACVRGWRGAGNELQTAMRGRWAWVAVALVALTLATSLQIGAFYGLLIWLVWLGGRLLAGLPLPLAAMAATVIIPVGLIIFVKLACPQLWAGFLEHAQLTPSATGWRVPQLADVLKVVRTVPGVLAVAGVLIWFAMRGRSLLYGSEVVTTLLVAVSATALAVMAASLFAVTPNMVQIANYLQPLVVGVFLTVLARTTHTFRSRRREGAEMENLETGPPPHVGDYRSSPFPAEAETCHRSLAGLPRWAVVMFLMLALLASVRLVGMSTWGVACAVDLNYTASRERLREELDAIPPGSTVVASSAYLYETARRDDVRWIHSDWPGDTAGFQANWERDALIALRPARLIITQFDYYRRYERVLKELNQEAGLVDIKVHNFARVNPPDASRLTQKVVQHVAWAPVVVEFTWP
ncbi:MAG: hypothetical protein KIS67_27470 [Verrucomicrobiae bacterium]|nr:hypothetical protein [Verrucomicrobiae bacterium]